MEEQYAWENPGEVWVPPWSPALEGIGGLMAERIFAPDESEYQMTSPGFTPAEAQHAASLYTVWIPDAPTVGPAMDVYVDTGIDDPGTYFERPAVAAWVSAARPAESPAGPADIINPNQPLVIGPTGDLYVETGVDEPGPYYAPEVVGAPPGMGDPGSVATALPEPTDPEISAYLPDPTDPTDPAWANPALTEDPAAADGIGAPDLDWWNPADWDDYYDKGKGAADDAVIDLLPWLDDETGGVDLDPGEGSGLPGQFRENLGGVLEVGGLIGMMVLMQMMEGFGGR